MSPSTGGMGESFGPDTQTDGLGTLLDLLDTPPDVPPTCLVTDAVSTDHMGLAFQVDSAGKRPLQVHFSLNQGSLMFMAFGLRTPELLSADLIGLVTNRTSRTS